MKNIGVLVTIILAVIGGSVGYGQLKNQTKGNTEKVKEVKIEVKEKVDEVKKEIKENKKNIDDVQTFTIKQMMLNERMSILMDNIEKKIDK